MATTDESRSEIPSTGGQEDCSASKLQLQLAESILGRLIERNRGLDVAGAFWEDDTFDSDDVGEYLDPELWDPDEETLPETAEIEWNLYPCN